MRFEGMLEGIQLKEEIPEMDIGDQIKVHVKTVEGDKERIQVFAGTVIAFSGTGISKSVKVRKISFGEGVEKTFLLHSPLLMKIELVRKSQIRRAKLYYLRDKIGKKARLKEKKKQLK